jgi:hypothetical protein
MDVLSFLNEGDDKKCFEEKRRREEKEAEKLEMCQDIWALALSISTSSRETGIRVLSNRVKEGVSFLG